MNELIKQHYEAIVKRGLIKPDTTDREFSKAAISELIEWTEDFETQEAIDLVAVVLNSLHHKGVDIESEFKKNINHQIERVK